MQHVSCARYGTTPGSMPILCIAGRLALRHVSDRCDAQLYYMQGISDIAQLVDTKMANEWLKAANAIYAVYQAKGGQPFESR